MAYEDILYDARDGVAWLTINRPEVRNAFRARTVDELIKAFRAAWADPEVGVVVLTGAGDKAFSAGGDQRERTQGGYTGGAGLGMDMHVLHGVIRAIPKPVIAMVNGYARRARPRAASPSSPSTPTPSTSRASPSSASARSSSTTRPTRHSRDATPSSRSARPASESHAHEAAGAAAPGRARAGAAVGPDRDAPGALGVRCPSHRARRQRALDGDQDRVALDLHLVALDALALVHRVAARGHVVLPAVPRAGDDHAVELALPERPAAVEAGVVHGVERTAHVEERDLLAARLDALARSGRDVADGGDSREGRHGAASGTRPGTGQDASAAAMGGSAPRRSSHSPTAATWSTSRASA